MNYTERIPIPSPESINSGLTSPPASLMRSLLGSPRKVLTTDCKPVDNAVLLKSMELGRFDHFKVTGHKLAIASLERIMARVKVEHPDLYPLIGTAGMLCCRLVRGSTSSPSNHSWGTAIDLTIGGELDAVGDGHCQRGLLTLYPYFHAEGWYWGCEFSGKREDSMHFEIAAETMKAWRAKRLI